MSDPLNFAARIGAPAQHAVATGDIPGVVCLIWRRGELLYVDSAGLRDVEARLPVERNTIFRIASMSKPVTTAAAMILLERGVWRAGGSHHEVGAGVRRDAGVAPA